MASLTLLDLSTQTSLSTIISPQPTPTSSPTPTSPLLITPNDLSASATIQTVTFGVLGILLAITALILAYLQLRHQYRTTSRRIAATDPETPSHRTNTAIPLQDVEAQDGPGQSELSPQYQLGPLTVLSMTPIAAAAAAGYADGGLGPVKLNLAAKVIDNRCLDEA